jgi:plasmid maintenance system antidote protein VapI
MVKLQDFKIDCLAPRFWSKVELTHLVPFDGCWNWIGGERLGYGSITLFKDGKPKIMQAHRVAYLLTYGEIPDGLFVLHACDNRKCVKPSHLFLGDNGDNMRDMMQKGRANLDRKAQRKLTPTDAEAIRKRYAMRTSQTTMAKKYGLEQWQISRIVRGKKVRGVSKANEIRSEYSDCSKITMGSLAREYGVHWRTIFAVIHEERYFKNWRD